MKRDTIRQQVIKNAVAVLNGDLGEEARRCFLVFVKAQKRAETQRAAVINTHPPQAAQRLSRTLSPERREHFRG